MLDVLEDMVGVYLHHRAVRDQIQGLVQIGLYIHAVEGPQIEIEHPGGGFAAAPQIEAHAIALFQG